MFGSMWRQQDRPGRLAPSATARGDVLHLPHRSTSPRVIRTTAGTLATAERDRPRCISDGPRIAASPTANTRNGKASITSISRDTIGSSQPPVVAGHQPDRHADHHGQQRGQHAGLQRVPRRRTRPGESTSRPRSSVPSRCAGRRRRSDRVEVRASEGRTARARGPAAASTTTTTTTDQPIGQRRRQPARSAAAPAAAVARRRSAVDRAGPSVDRAHAAPPRPGCAG